MSAEMDLNANDSAKSEHMMADASAKIGEIAEPLKEKAEQIAETQKQAGTSHVHTLATAVHGAARELEQGMPRLANSVHEVARKIEETAGAVRNKKIDELVDDLGRYAREQPGLVFGGAVIAGIVLSRFLKSSSASSVRQPSGV
jgi:methyl-accepting chemotaxis protein